MFMMDPLYMVLVLPAILLALFAQMKVKTSFAKYSAVRASRGLDAGAVSRMLLDKFGLQRVRIERVSGELTDHYDPRGKVLRLSDSVGGSSSIAAIGVAAHEVGHAMQDKEGYIPLSIRNTFVPVASIGSTAAIPLFLIGLFMGLGPLVNIGIFLFSGVVLFHLITLPVEFDASARALKALRGAGTLTQGEIVGAKNVLNAAAMTYVAATLVAIMNLLWLVMRSQGRRN
ncbi:MAG: zinc metallopeptidase [Synergistaceae bacterium]|jgi:Zn-dependent membrane protease YugP|nr:zinc metallopeptidase [Synergistaceae bacterium]